MARGFQQPTRIAPRGIWLVASELLRRPVRAGDMIAGLWTLNDEPYPHICGNALPAPRGVRPPRIQRRECAACVEQDGSL